MFVPSLFLCLSQRVGNSSLSSTSLCAYICQIETQFIHPKTCSSETYIQSVVFSMCRVVRPSDFRAFHQPVKKPHVFTAPVTTSAPPACVHLLLLDIVWIVLFSPFKYVFFAHDFGALLLDAHIFISFISSWYKLTLSHSKMSFIPNDIFVLKFDHFLRSPTLWYW